MASRATQLRARLVQRNGLLVGLAALLPMLALAGAFVCVLLDSLRQYRAADEGRLRDTARSLTAAVDARLGTFVEVAQALVRSGLLDDIEDREAFAAAATRIGAGLPGWFVLIGPGPEHLVLTTTLPQRTEQRPGPISDEARAILDKVLAGVFEGRRAMVSDLFVDGVVRREVLTVMVPVGPSTPLGAALSLSFGPELLQNLLSRQDLPEDTFAVIGDGRFRVVAHSRGADGRLVGRQAPAWIVEAMAGRSSAILTGPGMEGAPYIYAIERPSLAPHWTVAVAEPLSVQQASAWQALRWLLAASGALCLGIAATVWALRREAMRDARREAEALRAVRVELDRVLGGLPAVIFLRRLGPDGTNHLISRRGDIEAVTGWPAATFAEADNFQSVVDLAVAEYDAFFDRVVRDGAGTIEYRMRQPGGGWRTLRARCRLLGQWEDGRSEVVGYILDVSAEREAEARAMVATRLASLGEMAAGLAHEMKQPLQSISLAAELGQMAAARGNAPEVDAEFERIVEQTQRTAQMIDHLRRFARGAEDGAPTQAVPLDEAVEGALLLTRSVLRDVSIEVEVDVGDPSLVVRGQGVLLEQVLSNLLLNARDALAMRPPGAARRIRIAAAYGAKGTVMLSVADTGGGIAPEVMTRLFEPFVTTKGPEKGTGLGLSLCHGLVHGMAGTIEAHNDTEGAVFTITLPAASKEETLSARTKRTAG